MNTDETLNPFLTLPLTHISFLFLHFVAFVAASREKSLLWVILCLSTYNKKAAQSAKTDRSGSFTTMKKFNLHAIIVSS